jgi:putative transposase
MREAGPKKGYSALVVGRNQSIQLIDTLRAHEMLEFVCRTLGICRSVYYAAKQRKKTIDVLQMILSIQVRKLTKDSRRSAGSRTLMDQLCELGYPVVGYKVHRLMAEANLVSSQPEHKYKKTGQARVDIPNLLERQFPVAQPIQVWCGDITYVWALDRWHYLAVVMDLHTRRMVGFALSDKLNGELVTTAFEKARRERRLGSG